jgi:hypothetical protein
LHSVLVRSEYISGRSFLQLVQHMTPNTARSWSSRSVEPQWTQVGFSLGSRDMAVGTSRDDASVQVLRG